MKLTQNQLEILRRKDLKDKYKEIKQTKGQLIKQIRPVRARNVHFIRAIYVKNVLGMKGKRGLFTSQ